MMSALFALAMALPLRAQTAFFENTDSPEFQGTRLLRTGILVRAEHDGSHSISANHQSERMERQALLAGLYASGSSMPEEAGMFLYGIDAAVMARVVRQEESRGPNEPARENLFFEPGRQTFAGITLCASVRCGWTAGRGKPEPALASALDSVAGSHGPVTGTTVFFHGEHMLLHLTPWFLPGATGGGLDGLYSGRQIDMDGQSGRGARIEAGAFFQHGGIAVHYESVSANNPLGQTCKAVSASTLRVLGFYCAKNRDSGSSISLPARSTLLDVMRPLQTMNPEIRLHESRDPQHGLASFWESGRSSSRRISFCQSQALLCPDGVRLRRFQAMSHTAMLSTPQICGL